MKKVTGGTDPVMVCNIEGACGISIEVAPNIWQTRFGLCEPVQCMCQYGDIKQPSWQCWNSAG